MAARRRRLALSISVLACATAQAGPTPLDSEHAPAVIEAQRADPAQLRFVVLGDRTGGHRAGVFAQAIERTRLLHPDLVINVGDLVEGYTDEPQRIAQQWREVLADARALDAPLVLVPGNHDLSNPQMLAWWRDHLGASYSAFRQDDVLFLILDTEDPPPSAPQSEIDELLAMNQRANELRASDPEQVASLHKRFAQRAGPLMKTAISATQLDYFEQVLADNHDVRWTFVMLHKPAWRGAYADERFAQLESRLADRPYTVIAGHTHVYAHEVRKGRDYFTLGTAGGELHQPDSPRSMDHLLMVTMGRQGPDYANLLLSGFVPLEGYADVTGPGLLLTPGSSP
ncbi:MAG: metallophosphoesterase [Pseudomonadota bacterium]|nr:metallophosphoesterase [Pseudomonadota bacterium]